MTLFPGQPIRTLSFFVRLGFFMRLGSLMDAANERITRRVVPQTPCSDHLADY